MVPKSFTTSGGKGRVAFPATGRVAMIADKSISSIDRTPAIPAIQRIRNKRGLKFMGRQLSIPKQGCLKHPVTANQPWLVSGVTVPQCGNACLTGILLRLTTRANRRSYGLLQQIDDLRLKLCFIICPIAVNLPGEIA